MSRAVPWVVLAALLVEAFFGVVVFVAHDAGAYSFHSPIRIVGDGDFTSGNGVVRGTGTIADPFVIEGYDISNETGTGIEIISTDAFFVIKDCFVHNSSYGILLSYISNGTIEDCSVLDNARSIAVYESTNVAVNNNDVSAEYGCIGFGMSSECVAYGNNCTIKADGGGIRSYQSQSIRIEQNSILGYHSYGLYVEESEDIIVKSNTVYGDGCQLEESRTVRMWSNTFLLSGITLAGTDVRSYDSLDIPTNNTANGLPIFYVHSTSVGEYSFGTAGQIIVANCSNIEIRDSSVKQVAWKGGIECYLSDRVVFSSMTVTECGVGLVLYCTDNVTLQNSTMLENYNNLEATSSNSTLVVGCTMINSFTEGWPKAMSFRNCNFTRVIDCQIRYVGELIDPMTLYRFGIGFLSIHEALVQNCTIENSTGSAVDCASYTFQSDGLTVRECRISECYWSAVGVSGTNDVIIENNSFALTDRAIDVYDCVGVEIRNNSLLLNEWCGALLRDVNWCNVTGNCFAWNDDEGVMMEGSNITIAWNSFIESGCGIEGGRYDVLIHHNDFIQNLEPINPYVCYRSSWDDGYPSGGNYYSDYAGLDEFSGPDQNIPGSDGLGDSPYTHDWYFPYEDRYPLMAPALSHGSAPSATLEPLPSSGSILTSFEFNASGSSDPETPDSDLWVRWDFDGDGTWDTGWAHQMTIRHEFGSVGTYDVTVQILDLSGLNSTATVSVEVTDDPVIPEFPGFLVPVLGLACLVVMLSGKRRRELCVSEKPIG